VIWGLDGVGFAEEVPPAAKEKTQGFSLSVDWDQKVGEESCHYEK